jgi:aminopeptidase N
MIGEYMKVRTTLAICLLLTLAAFACPGMSILPQYNYTLPPELRGNSPQSNEVAPPFPDITKNYDVRHYAMNLTVLDSPQEISGYCEVKLRATQSLNQVTLLFNGLTIDSITMGGVNQSYARNGEHLDISLSQSFTTGQDFTLHIVYHGAPTLGPDGGIRWQNNAIFTDCECIGARYWFPCYDHPSDKADEGVQVTLHVPAGREAVSQGTMVSHVGDTWVWNSTYPIATYLVSFAIKDYGTVNQSYLGMPMDTWCNVGTESSIATNVQNAPLMMSLFATKFGQFPFLAEKYDMCNVPVGGMENQTCTSLYLPSNEDTISHEMAHSWYGDNVTCGDWRDLWLNEGFATYLDALWVENHSGETQFQAHMQDDAQSYFDEDEVARFPIYNPEELWSSTVYSKGGWVLHMLRKVMGDTGFFNMMVNYEATYAGSTALTTDFQAKAEQYYGQDLDWFFNQWVYQAGYPILMLSYSNIGPEPNSIDVRITQTQSGDLTPAFFKMPIDIRLVTSLGNEDHTVWLYDTRSCFHFTASSPVTNVILDPNTWLLHKESPAVGVNVTDFTAERHPTSVKLTWACSESNISFDLFRGIADGNGTASLNMSQKTSGYKKINSQKITGHTPFSYTDQGLEPKLSYQYVLVGTDSAGKQETFGPVSADARILVQSFSLDKPRPNPARSLAIFTGNADSVHPAQMVIYDLSGRVVQKHTISVGSGTWQWDWNLTDSAGQRLSTGVYIITASAGAQRYNTRLVVAH